MNIEKDKVVTFHYRLSDDKGNEIENSQAQEPLSILYGHGNIIPGLEQAMNGRSAGDTFDVVVPPEQAYGEYRADFTQRVPKKYFRDAEQLLALYRRDPDAFAERELWRTVQPLLQRFAFVKRHH